MRAAQLPPAPHKAVLEMHHHILAVQAALLKVTPAVPTAKGDDVVNSLNSFLRALNQTILEAEPKQSAEISAKRRKLEAFVQTLE